MARGYLLNNKKDTPACFDYFFRKNPFKGGYVIFAGLTDLLEVLENLRFDDEDCKYLRSLIILKGLSSGRIFMHRKKEKWFSLMSHCKGGREDYRDADYRDNAFE